MIYINQGDQLMPTDIIFNSEEYRELKFRLNTELKYIMFNYPGHCDKPQLKIINQDGLTVIYGDYETVISVAQNALNNQDKD